MESLKPLGSRMFPAVRGTPDHTDWGGGGRELLQRDHKGRRSVEIASKFTFKITMTYDFAKCCALKEVILGRRATRFF